MAPGPGAAGPATGAAAGQVADYALEVVMAIVDNGHYAIFQIDVECCQEGVQLIVHTKGLTPSAGN